MSRQSDHGSSRCRAEKPYFPGTPRRQCQQFARIGRLRVGEKIFAPEASGRRRCAGVVRPRIDAESGRSRLPRGRQGRGSRPPGVLEHHLDEAAGPSGCACAPARAPHRITFETYDDFPAICILSVHLTSGQSKPLSPGQENNCGAYVGQVQHRLSPGGPPKPGHSMPGF